MAVASVVRVASVIPATANEDQKEESTDSETERSVLGWVLRFVFVSGIVVGSDVAIRLYVSVFVCVCSCVRN